MESGRLKGSKFEDFRMSAQESAIEDTDAMPINMQDVLESIADEE